MYLWTQICVFVRTFCVFTERTSFRQGYRMTRIFFFIINCNVSVINSFRSTSIELFYPDTGSSKCYFVHVFHSFSVFEVHIHSLSVSHGLLADSDPHLGMAIHPKNGYSNDQGSGSRCESQSESMQWEQFLYSTM